MAEDVGTVYLGITGFEDPRRHTDYEITIDDRNGVTVYSECCASSMSDEVARQVHDALGRYLARPQTERVSFYARPEAVDNRRGRGLST